MLLHRRRGRLTASLRRRASLAALAAAVVGAHLWLAQACWPPALGGGPSRAPARIAVAFVHVLRPAPPPPAVAVAAARRRAAPPGGVRSLAAVPAQAASAASDASPQPADPALAPLPLMTSLLSPTLALADLPAAPASAAGPASGPAAAFEWPPSTRLRYRLSGNYRGPVEGRASVEWRRDGTHYQVAMDLEIGAPFAPLVTRHAVSDGDITPEGLAPRRYDEETRVALRDAHRLTVHMDADAVRLADGALAPRPSGLQDSVSQFVQLTWLYTREPQRLVPGQVVMLALALPRSVEPWVYDVVGRETLDTPAGPVATVHLVPRRPPQAGRVLTAEIWIAPSLQYLPVRILVRRDAATYVDLSLDHLPQQAEPGR
ncbi:MAG: DUF3108 domain-containing protein [Burkholderiales bacterium]|nr:DUF3108 domain-containing protein [Burkholderiales bacterium]